MIRQYPNIAVKRSPKNTWIIVEYIGTLYDKNTGQSTATLSGKRKPSQNIKHSKRQQRKPNTSEPTEAKGIKNGKYRLIAMD